MADIKTTVDAMKLEDLTKPDEEAVEPSEPVLLKAVIEAIVADLVAGDLGYFQIGRKHSALESQVVEIDECRKARVAASIEEAEPKVIVK